MIETIDLNKSFGSVKAVKGLNLSIPGGEIYGLVGSDGAGKTTTLRLLVGALRPDSGQVSICGFPIDRQVEQARAQIGYLSQRFSLYEDLTVLENIRFFAEVRGLSASQWLPRSMEILEFVGLATFKDRKAGLLSGGMKQKLGLASAMVSQPRVLLLDEPTTGVDPVTRQDFWQLLVKLVSNKNQNIGQVAVIITTPYMDEAARCNRIGFMRQGELIAEGTPTQLRSQLEGRILELRGSPLRELSGLAASDPGVEDVRLFGDRLHLRTKIGKTSETIRQLEQTILGKGFKFDSIRPVSANLEDIFILLSEQELNSNQSVLELSDSHTKTLMFLLDRFPPEEYSWILTGSSSLRLQGVDIDVHDLDIEGNPDNIHRLQQALNEFTTTPLHLWETGKIRSLQGVAEIDGVKVELVANLNVQQPDGRWENVLDFERCTWLNWHGRRIKIFSLNDEAMAYKAMGRDEKALLIQEAIRKIKEKTDD